MKIVALLGPSGVGKGWLKSYLVKKSNLDFFLPRVITTRPARKDDLENRKISVSLFEFDSKVKKGEIVYPHTLLSTATTYKYGFFLDDLNLYPEKNLLIELYPTLLPAFKLTYKTNLISIGLLANKNILESNLIKRGTENYLTLTDKIESAEPETKLLLLHYYKKSYLDYLVELEKTENLSTIVEQIIKSI